MIVYLMRGLPSSGKSYTAQRLAGDTGVVLETDQYFYTQVGSDPAHYDYDLDLLETARQWNYDRFERALEAGITPIVVDRGNGLNRESQRYARRAVECGYAVQLREPESEWWQEIRVLLKYKHLTGEVLEVWAKELSARSRATHRVPAETIRNWMDKWRHDLTIEEIIDFD